MMRSDHLRSEVRKARIPGERFLPERSPCLITAFWFYLYNISVEIGRFAGFDLAYFSANDSPVDRSFLLAKSKEIRTRWSLPQRRRSSAVATAPLTPPQVMHHHKCTLCHPYAIEHHFYNAPRTTMQATRAPRIQISSANQRLPRPAPLA